MAKNDSHEWLFLLKWVVELDFDLDVRYVELEPMELEDKDFPRLSELFLMILVAVLLQSERTKKTLLVGL